MSKKNINLEYIKNILAAGKRKKIQKFISFVKGKNKLLKMLENEIKRADRITKRGIRVELSEIF